jgi:hypothetical protein
MGQMYENKIKLLGENNQVIFKGTVNLLPLDEKLIIQKSKQFFNDSEPCFIHRSAVMKRLYSELEEYVSKINTTQSISVQEIPPEIREILSSIDGIRMLVIADFI